MHVEFLQACVYAEQYRYAERVTTANNFWPRPMGSSHSHSHGHNVSVRQVLRYYYLRGTVHVGCQHYQLAVRCFWTCLSVPAETVSAVAVAAWKKMVLLQCLLQSDVPAVSLTAAQLLATPTAAPSCVGRFLTLAAAVKSSSNNNNNNNPAAAVTGGGRGRGSGIAGNENDMYNNNNNNHAVGSSSTGRQQRQGQGQPEQVMNMVEGTSSEGSAMSSSTTGHEGQRQGHGQQTLPLTNQANGMGVHVYTELIHAFVKVDRPAFQKIMQQHGAQLVTDGNAGLVAQLCQSELVKRQVYEWSRVYAVISLEQLSGMLEMAVAEVQALLLQLSMEKKWKIQMDDDGMVVFPKLGAAEHSSAEDAKDVEELIQLTKVVQKLDVNVASSSKYHTFVRRENTAAATATKSSEGKGGPRGVEDVAGFLA